MNDRHLLKGLTIVGAAVIGLVLTRGLGPPMRDQLPGSSAKAPSGETAFSYPVTIDPGLVKRAFKPERLYLPTAVEKLGDRYFIVDCYNNRVLYSTDLFAPLTAWRVLDEDLSRPHSIASDGRYFVVDDTDAHEIKIYQRQGDGFLLTQTIGNVGARPHRVRYDPRTSAFYVLASESQHMTKLIAEDNGLAVQYTKKLPFLGRSYTRSFGIVDGKMIFVSGPRMLTVVDYVDDEYGVLESWEVPTGYQSMNDIMRVGEVYYISVTMNNIIRCETLPDLPQGKCQSVYEKMAFRGNPYFFSRFDGRVFVTELTGRDDVLMFDIEGDELVFNRAIFTDR